MKTVLITGASRGIGLETAKIFLNNGFFVLATSTTGEIPISHNNLKKIKLDFLTPDSINAAEKELAENKIDILINNAAVLIEPWDRSKIDMDILRKTFNVNVFGLIDFCERILPKIKPGGHILNLSSEWGTFSAKNQSPFQPHYKLSKAAVNMYTVVLASRLKQENIKVSSVDPEWCRTDMGTQEATKDAKDAAEDIFKTANSENIESGKFWRSGVKRDW